MSFWIPNTTALIAENARNCLVFSRIQLGWVIIVWILDFGHAIPICICLTYSLSVAILQVLNAKQYQLQNFLSAAWQPGCCLLLNYYAVILCQNPLSVLLTPPFTSQTRQINSSSSLLLDLLHKCSLLSAISGDLVTP